MALQPVLFVDQRPATAITIPSVSTELLKTTGLRSVGRQGTLRWTCLIRRLTRITRLRDRVMTMAVAKGRTTDKTPAPTPSMLRISSGKLPHDLGGRTHQLCGL